MLEVSISGLNTGKEKFVPLVDGVVERALYQPTRHSDGASNRPDPCVCVVNSVLHNTQTL